MGLVAGGGLEVLDLAHDALAVDDLSEDDVLLVEVGGRDGGDEELGAVGSYCEISTPFELFQIRQGFHIPGPALAMLNRNGFSCSFSKFSSSNFSPYMLSPPVPLPIVKSPPWIMKDLMTRWKPDPL